MKMLTFEPITKYERGFIFSLLSKSFAKLWNDEPERKIRRYDDELFAYPDTVGACLFVSELNGEAVGMASWDPRQGPEIGIIGYNCILPDYQGRGYGKAQIAEVIRRLKEQGFQKIAVTTGEHPFFEPADRMYLACGFREIRRYEEGRDPRYGSIDYEMNLAEDLRLIEPTADLKAEFLAMAREFESGGDQHIAGIGSIDLKDFDASVERAKGHARGIGLPTGWVPAATYWLVCCNRLIGTANLRYELNDFLRDYGGHIGYAVRPSEQKKGYGTQMLTLTLEKAKAIGSTKVLVTCDKSNIGSRRVIEKNGGVLENEVIASDTGKPLLRFWIDVK